VLKTVNTNFLREMKLIKLLLKINLILIPFLLSAQHLRDKTKIINPDSFYPSINPIAKYGDDYKKYTLIFDNIFNIPEINVKIGENHFTFYFDFGNSGNIVITSYIKNNIEYSILDSSYTYNSDGSLRDKTFNIEIPKFQVFDSLYTNEKCTLADWNIFSTNPFNGLIGLKYLQNKCFTLDCINRKLIISSHSILDSLSEKDAEIINLETYKYHPFGVHFIGKVNGKESIIYFDTGKSRSAINRSLIPEEGIVPNKSGTFYAGTVELYFGNISLKVEYPMVKKIKRSVESELPVGIEVGIDVLKYFVLTIDRTDNRNVIIFHK